MLSLVLASLYIAGLHLGIAGTPVRDRLVAAVGLNAYRGLFSAASLAGLIWLVLAYKHAPYIATWGVPQWWKPVAIVLMLPAFLLAFLGLRTPNPTAAGMEG